MTQPPPFSAATIMAHAAAPPNFPSITDIIARVPSACKSVPIASPLTITSSSFRLTHVPAADDDVRRLSSEFRRAIVSRASKTARPRANLPSPPPSFNHLKLHSSSRLPIIRVLTALSSDSRMAGARPRVACAHQPAFPRRLRREGECLTVMAVLMVMVMIIVMADSTRTAFLFPFSM